jgi:hypothetical protein
MLITKAQTMTRFVLSTDNCVQQRNQMAGTCVYSIEVFFQRPQARMQTEQVTHLR